MLEPLDDLEVEEDRVTGPDEVEDDLAVDIESLVNVPGLKSLVRERIEEDAAVARGSHVGDDYELELLQIDDIDFPEDVPDDLVHQLFAESLRHHGQVEPIWVRRVGKRYTAVAGRHRLRGLASVGAVSALAFVIPEGSEHDLFAAGVACDSNFVRATLMPAEVDRLADEYVRIREALDPASARSNAKVAAGRASARARRGAGAESAPVGATACTARASGKSVRSIQQALKRRRDAAPRVWKEYADGKLIPSAVDELAKLPNEEQVAVLQKLPDRNLATVRSVVRDALGLNASAKATPARALGRLTAALQRVDVHLNVAATVSTTDLAELDEQVRRTNARLLRDYAARLESVADALAADDQRVATGRTEKAQKRPAGNGRGGRR